MFQVPWQTPGVVWVSLSCFGPGSIERLQFSGLNEMAVGTVIVCVGKPLIETSQGSGTIRGFALIVERRVAYSWGFERVWAYRRVDNYEKY